MTPMSKSSRPTPVPLDDTAKLADIPWPTVMFEILYCLRAQSFKYLACRALPIFPVEDDLFVCKSIDAQIKFVRDKSGRVIGAIHSQGGRKLQIDKIQ